MCIQGWGRPKSPQLKDITPFLKLKSLKLKNGIDSELCASKRLLLVQISLGCDLDECFYILEVLFQSYYRARTTVNYQKSEFNISVFFHVSKEGFRATKGLLFLENSSRKDIRFYYSSKMERREMAQ